MRKRTWPVFLVGIGTMLLLIFLPGIAALRQSQRIFEEIRQMQREQERSQATLSEIERKIPLLSVVVRDSLIDNSPTRADQYRQQFTALRAEIEGGARSLAEHAPPSQAGMFDQLRLQLEEYAAGIAPVFTWPPSERAARGTYFLREQQRPRRQGILAIADEISRLNSENYRRRYDDINASQNRYRAQLEIAVAAAFLLGVGVAAATVLRISALERQAERQRLANIKAEEEMRRLSAQLMRAQEDERRTLARELHDEVGQMLTALRIELGTLDMLRNAPGNDFQLRLEDVKSVAEQTMRTVRDIAMGLRPSVLDLGLEAALQWQTRHFSRRTGTPATVQIEGILPSLPDSHLTCVYRIVQEALTNSAKHAKASKVEVHVKNAGSALELDVKDDGVGLAAEWRSNGGSGLIGMEERAREVGGELKVASEKGKGMAIHVRLPLPKEAVG